MYDYGDLAANYVNKNGFVRYWNDTAKVPYLYNATTGTFISYDDNESMKYKTDYIKTKGLSGAMFWELSGIAVQVQNIVVVVQNYLIR